MRKSSEPKYLSPRKIQKIRSNDIPKSRKGKSLVNAHKSAILNQIDKDKDLLETIVRVRDVRASIVRGSGGQIDFLSVYGENDYDYAVHGIDVRYFPKWRELSDLMKAYLGFLLSTICNGYSFTAVINPDLEASWLKNDVDPLDRVKRMLSKQLSKHKINGMPLFLTLEGKSRTGKSRTQLHIHGYFIPDNSLEATTMKKVFEDAFYPDLKIKKGSNIPVVIVRSYELPNSSNGAVRWVDYGVKNILSPGAKIKTSQIYLTNSLRGCVKEFWSIIRQDFDN